VLDSLVHRVEMRPLAVVVGASQGLGASLVWSFARAGYAVLAASRNVERLKTMQGDVHRTLPGSEVHVFRLDVTADARASQAMCGFVRDLGFTFVDVLVLNQGINHDACLAEWTDTSQFEECVHTNFIGSVRVLHSALPLLVENPRGARVVVVVSRAGVLQTVPGGAAYAASKAALDSFFSSVAPELRALGVKTLIVEPGSFEANDFAPRQVLAASGRYRKVTSRPLFLYTFIKSGASRTHARLRTKIII